MARHSFIRMSKLPNVKGRIDYISSPDRQENLYATYQTADTNFWKNLAKRLLAYAAKFPELCQQTDDDEQGGLRFEIDKSRISIRLTAPYSEERRKQYRDQAKRNSIFSKAI